MRLDTLNRTLRDILAPALGPGEGAAAARIILEDAAGITPVDIAANGDRELEQFTVDRLTAMARRVADGGEPVQYVVGRARFYGMELSVSPAVLIPRPETEGLVDMIADDADGRADLRVLDACTGSGCIAIALARTLPFASVDAFDISDDALAIARQNAADLGAGVRLFRADALRLTPALVPRYDIIVSNPPYIADSERRSMSPRVLLHEPAGALFVPDSDPLLFYRAIASYALRALEPGGRLYFEINALFADRTAGLLRELGFADVEVSRDFYSRPRYARATRPAE